MGPFSSDCVLRVWLLIEQLCLSYWQSVLFYILHVHPGAVANVNAPLWKLMLNNECIRHINLLNGNIHISNATYVF